MKTLAEVNDKDVDVNKIKEVCAGCHGLNGNSTVSTYPKLAGQHATYLYKQLKEIKSGERVIPLMTGQLDALDDSQLKSLADFYSQQTNQQLSAVDEKLKALGEKVYRVGNIEKGLPACTGCHSPTGQGNSAAVFPVLAGQHASYIVSSLKSFRKGAEYKGEGRSNDKMKGVMRTIALKMSDKEIDAVASYISSLH
jgi:cytochrome c553